MNPIPVSWMALGAVGVLAVGGLIGWHERGLRVPAELEAKQLEVQKQCNIEKQTTRRANEELQKNRDDIAARNAADKLQQPMRCVSVSRAPDLQRDRAEHAGHDGAGLSSDWLRDYAAICERYRTELKICINFLSDERKAAKP